jgi:hypothetical protein
LDGTNASFPNYFAECKKEAITPPSSGINNNEGEESPSLLQLKTEPVANPSSPESASIDLPHASQSADECAGCGRSIQVRFLTPSVAC